MAGMSMLARRIDDIEKNGRRSALPCMRCIDRYSRGDLSRPCLFGQNLDLWHAFRECDTQYFRCDGCLRDGQDCLAAPDGHEDDFRALDRDIRRVVTKKIPANLETGDPDFLDTGKDVTEDMKVRLVNRIMDKAGLLVESIKEVHRPYAKSLTAHNGSLVVGLSAQSGVYLQGRDRSKKAVLRREAAKRKALEDDSGSDEPLTPRKKTRYGVLGRGKTQAEVDQEEEDAREAAAAAARAARPKKRGGARGGATGSRITRRKPT